MTHDAMQTLIQNHARPDADLTFKKMFGGVGVYTHGHIFASISDIGLAFKLAPADQTELLKIDGAKFLQYEPTSPPSKHYVVLPESVLKDVAQLTVWLEKSLVYALTQPLPKKKKK